MSYHITAKKAAALSTSYIDEPKLKSITDQIRREATKGNSRLFVYQSLSKSVLDGLGILGFRVEPAPSIAIQKDGLYYTIYW